MNVVWLKRDLRSQDHEALAAAQNSSDPFVCIYLFEPQFIIYPDCDIRHLRFQYESLMELKKTFNQSNIPLIIAYSDAEDFFENFLLNNTVHKVFSYQESGTKATWERDKNVKSIFTEHNVQWIEFQRDGIIRGLTNRDNWEKKWYNTMHSPFTENEFKLQKNSFEIVNPFPLKKAFLKRLSTPNKKMQIGGESMAWKYLESFAKDRGHKYHRLISKPLESRKSCGRVSPYLSWGNLSIKQAYQYLYNHQRRQTNKTAFRGILTRFRWHCHFIQKFEVECDYEFTCVNRGYESLEHQFDELKIKAWKDGKTGFPLIDACMRCLKETGWINFRMRAMLVSFFCHHLDQDWREGIYHLAKLFLDYEPGIHYTQFQMQAGVTGVNTIRMYNPVKQALDHDPEAKFIKEWVPELKSLPVPFALEPWKLNIIEQTEYNFNLGDDYPLPIVNLEEAGKLARKKIWGHRKNELVKQEKQRILNTHTNRSK